MRTRVAFLFFFIAAGLGIATWVRRGDRGSRADYDDDADDAAIAHAAVAKASRSGGPVLDRANADRMREAIRLLLAEAGTLLPVTEDAAPSGWQGPMSATGRPLAPMPPPGPSADGGVDPLSAYIRERVREDFLPLARQCYQNELAQNPKLAGRAVLKFKIVGDKRIGGVVDDAKIDDKNSDMKSAAFTECMTESMMSVSFGAPPEGHGETTVEYPFEFTPNDDDAAAPH